LTGHVYLVGAGPGDVGLITVKGVEALKKADVVLYDRLVNPALLACAPREAVTEYVGKSLGSASAPRQKEIHQRLIAEAKAGNTVVRLKGGDPFVFGRGGEEALALHDADIPFTVIPGISSSIAGPGSAGIPVTHRGIADAFAVFAGHEGDNGEITENYWKAAALIPTAVFLIGVERLPQIAANLIRHGRSPKTKVAIISQATLPGQEVAVGTLETIVAASDGIQSPAVIIVGDTVGAREKLRAQAVLA